MLKLWHFALRIHEENQRMKQRRIVRLRRLLLDSPSSLSRTRWPTRLSTTAVHPSVMPSNSALREWVSRGDTRDPLAKHRGQPRACYSGLPWIPLSKHNGAGCSTKILHRRGQTPGIWFGRGRKAIEAGGCRKRKNGEFLKKKERKKKPAASALAHKSEVPQSSVARWS